jgi:hypothetical protein
MYYKKVTAIIDDFEGLSLEIYQNYFPVYESPLSESPRCFDELDDLSVILYDDGIDVAYGLNEVIESMKDKLSDWEDKTGQKFDEDLESYLQGIIDYHLEVTDVEEG